MHLDIRYVTHFVYPTPVWESQNVLRARPLDTDHQRVESYHLDVSPETVVRTFVDRWGTSVDSFGVLDPHSELIVDVTTRVDTKPPSRPEHDVPLERIRAEADAGRHWLFLQAGRHTQWTDEISRFAEDVIDGRSGVVSATLAVKQAVHERLAYVPGSTAIGVSPQAVLDQAGGVCQDFSHVAISMLRSAGIPARYVSGYFFASDVAGGEAPAESEIAVQTHAWVEVWVPGFGWWGIDPTNLLEAGERHVIIGRGRDYDDVLPMRGVYFGDSDHALATEVVMSTSGLTPTGVPAVDPSQAAAEQ